MIRSIQFKIIVVFFLIGIIVITGLGLVYIRSINNLEINLSNKEVGNIEQLAEFIQQMRNTNITALIISGIVFFIAGILIAIVLSRFVIYPINKLIKNAEKITEEEKKKDKMNSPKEEVKKSKSKKDMVNIENVLGVMTTELKEKLSEVSTQKNQIETILLHMTDGIIAFNMEGEIILINPAAKKFLSIRPEDLTFDDIFAKFKLGINMEKIIYLESWTSTEQRIQVENKYMNVFFAPFKNESDRPNGVIAVIQDITEHVKLDNMQKEFVADVSHELKTPITSIM